MKQKQTTGEDQERPVPRLHGGSLDGIQPRSDRRRTRTPGPEYTSGLTGCLAFSHRQHARGPARIDACRLPFQREDRPTTASYSYNGNGLRAAKTAGGTTTNFTLDGGEVVADYALRLKNRLGHEPPLWVTAYANDVMAYIPSRRVLKEGGYEGDTSMVVYGMPAKWAPPVEEKIVAKVHELVQEVMPKKR